MDTMDEMDTLGPKEDMDTLDPKEEMDTLDLSEGLNEWIYWRIYCIAIGHGLVHSVIHETYNSDRTKAFKRLPEIIVPGDYPPSPEIIPPFLTLTLEKPH